MYRLMRTIEASCSDPRTRAEVEALQHALPADGELAVHDISLMASNLTRAAAELDTTRIAANLSSTQVCSAVHELYPDLVLPEPDRCQAVGESAGDCEGLEDAVLLVPASGPAATDTVHRSSLCAPRPSLSTLAASSLYGTVLSRARLPLPPRANRPATATARIVDPDVRFSLRRLRALAVHPEQTAFSRDGSEQRGVHGWSMTGDQ